jgi:hypothetical protein
MLRNRLAMGFAFKSFAADDSYGPLQEECSCKLANLT